VRLKTPFVKTKVIFISVAFTYGYASKYFGAFQALMRKSNAGFIKQKRTRLGAFLLVFYAL